jgi:hypothetical protein
MKKFAFIFALYFFVNIPIMAQEISSLGDQKIYSTKLMNQGSELGSLNLVSSESNLEYLNNYDAFNEFKKKQVSDGKNMITFSPFRIFLARLNLKYERVTGKSLTWGTRVEYGGVYQSLFINPFARLYFFDTEATGLYTEFGAYGRNQFVSEYDPFYLDEISSGAGLRMHLGIQFMVGKKQNKPIDFSLFAQFDSAYDEFSEYESASLAIAGPAPILGFRLQTGLKF